MPEAPQPRLIDAAGLRALGIAFSRPHLWRLERDGRFPRRVPLSPRRHAWLRSEIDTWLRDRVSRQWKPADPAELPAVLSRINDTLATSPGKSLTSIFTVDKERRRIVLSIGQHDFRLATCKRIGAEPVRAADVVTFDKRRGISA